MFPVAYELLRHTFGVLDVASGEPVVRDHPLSAVGKHRRQQPAKHKSPTDTAGEQV